VGDADDENNQPSIFDRVNNAVGAFPNTVEGANHCPELNTACRPGLRGQSPESEIETSLDGTIEFAELASGCRREFDEIGSHHLKTKLLAENLEREGALCVGLGKGLLRFAKIDLVLEALE